jgi:hypothetical protein
LWGKHLLSDRSGQAAVPIEAPLIFLHIMKTVDGMNQLDRALYLNVVRSLDERIRDGAAGFDRALRRFRRLNAGYGRAYAASAPVRFVRRRVLDATRGARAEGQLYGARPANPAKPDAPHLRWPSWRIRCPI